MAFREKSAWVMALALLFGGAFYFYLVAQMSGAVGALAPPLVPTLVGYTVLMVVIAVVGHVLAAVTAPRDAAAPEDERDRQIVHRAGHLSSYVLAVGVVLALGGYLVTRDGDLLFYAVFGSLMLGSLVEYLTQIYLYRRGG
ncbi:MAG: hypothetical protein RIC56_08985 [Pseudomonadales bacterium]